MVQWVVEFTKENYADWNDVANRDVITPTCEITRQGTQPLYNYVTQNSYYDNQYDSNIEWKQGTYDQAGTWYESLGNAFGNYMNGVVGQTATLHIIDSDLYFEIEFTSWTSNNNGGGFSYTRTLVIPDPCETVLAYWGCTDNGYQEWSIVPGVAACNYDASASINDGSCDYVSCADDCDIPNGDNSACTDCDGVINGTNWDCADDCGVANGDNSSCSGCTWADAINYDMFATINDGSCLVLDCGYDGDEVVYFEKENYTIIIYLKIVI